MRRTREGEDSSFPLRGKVRMGAGLRAQSSPYTKAKIAIRATTPREFRLLQIDDPRIVVQYGMAALLLALRNFASVSRCALKPSTVHLEVYQEDRHEREANVSGASEHKRAECRTGA